MRKVPSVYEICGSRNYNVPKKETSIKRLQLRKYCSRCNEHAMHKESK